MTEWWQDLKSHEARVYSQCGEDGVIAEIFAHIGAKTRTLVDIGAGDRFSNSNTRALLQEGWKGHLFDVQPFPEVHAERFTAENACSILAECKVPTEVDLLSLDIDGVDWYVLRSLLDGGYRPRVIVVEFVCGLPADPPVAVKYDPAFRFDGCMYHGASLGAYRVLGEAYGYLLVHQCGLLNAVLIRKDCLPEGATAGDLGFFQFQAESGDPLKREWVPV